MAETSTIEWTDATWQIVTGCSIETPGCTNCYAMKLAGSRLRHHPSRAGLTRETKAGPVWTGEVRFNEQWLLQPLLWARGRNIFVAAHGDLFHPGVPDAVLDRIFAVMAASSQHTFQVLTKRSGRARAYLSAPDIVARIIAALEALSEQIGPGKNSRDPRGGAGWNCFAAAENLKLGNERSSWPLWPLKNVWLGVSAEDQRRADERVPDLTMTPAAVRFVSAEPLLGPIDYTRIEAARVTDGEGRTVTYPKRINALNGRAGHYPSPTIFYHDSHRVGARLDWIVVGGESGPGARPMHPDWARQIRDACAAAGVAYLFKQWGSYQHGSTMGRNPGADRIVFNDGRMLADCTMPACKAEERERGWQGRAPEMMALVGKKAAGRLLDGVEHNGMPEVRHGG